MTIWIVSLAIRLKSVRKKCFSLSSCSFQAISSTLGTGKVKFAPKEDGIALPDMRVSFAAILLQKSQFSENITGHHT